MKHKIIVRATQLENSKFLLESIKYGAISEVDSIDQAQEEMVEALAHQSGRNEKDIEVVVVEDLVCEKFEDFLEKIVNERYDGMSLIPDVEYDGVFKVHLVKGDKHFLCTLYLEEEREDGVGIDLNIYKKSDKDIERFYEHYDASTDEIINDIHKFFKTIEKKDAT